MAADPKPTRGWTRCWPLVLAAGWLAVISARADEAPPWPLADEPPMTADRILQLSVAETALRLGFAAEAVRQYAALAAAVPEEEVLLGWSDALWAVGADGEAHEVLARLPGSRPRVALRRALQAWGRGEPVGPEVAWAAGASDLPAEERPWVEFLRGVEADGRGDLAAADAAYARAAAMATSRGQRARFEIARWQGRLRLAPADDAAIARLRTQVDEFGGRRVGFQFAQQLAVALQQQGRMEEAIALLQGQLAQVPAGDGESRDRLLLILGLVAGTGNRVGRQALAQILVAGEDASAGQWALQRLAAGEGGEGADEGFLALLDRLLERDPPHPWTEDLLIYRAQLRLRMGRAVEAESDARNLLEQFPASVWRRSALAVWAEVAWRDRRFLTAAEVLGRLRSDLAEGRERGRLSLLVAEASFRAGEYKGAAEAYAAAFAELRGEDRGPVLFQQVLAELRGGLLDQALGTLDTLGSAEGVSGAARWRAEWNVLKSLQAAGRMAEALARLDRILAETAPGQALEAELEVRLRWLRARLALDGGRTGEVPISVDGLAGFLASDRASVLPAALRAEVESHALLLRAEARLIEGLGERLRPELEEIRTRFPGSEAAIQSYLLEARDLAARGALVEAEALLVRLADEHRGTRYAALALFESALLAERRGGARPLEQAVARLERLAVEHPRDPLVFAARLRQGDMLRLRNDFEAAQQVYEALVNRDPGHPSAGTAQLALADTLLAQGGARGPRFAAAASLLERLVDLATAPLALRLEAAVKLGAAYQGREQPDRAADILLAAWAVVRSGPGLDGLSGSGGRYWFSRCLLDLGALMERARRPEEARRAYEEILGLGLPGASVARARLQGLVVSPPAAVEGGVGVLAR